MKLVRLVVLLYPFSNKMGEEAAGAATKEMMLLLKLGFINS